MKSIILCITNDFNYDRRIKRSTDALRKQFNVRVFDRLIHSRSSSDTIRCWFSRGFLFYAEFNLRLLLKLLFNKVDIIGSIDYDTLPACTLAAKIKSCKLVFDAHELYEESMEIQSRKAIAKFWFGIGQICVPKVNRAYTVSHSLADYYMHLHRLPFQVIRNLPYSSQSVKTVGKADKKIIIYQGVLNKGRMLELLVKVTNYLPQNFQVWILGEGDCGIDLRKMAGERVVFKSWVTPENLMMHTAQSFLGYNLLDDSSQSYEFSLANKFFDYMHAGIPSLNSPFPEYERYNERYNCCYTKHVDGAEQLASWILEIDKEQTVYEEKCKNAQLAALDLNWQKEQNKLIRIYDFDRHTHI
ncbi:glycosyltransferase family protein [Portibacter marinus]|uniref:glycosyltransferase n=1 Tax=Portibacter marinus TaxID=2898660 RepID=UPI001F2E0753|nr:glycosyltransferase [Portibacter marinus]